MVVERSAPVLAMPISEKKLTESARQQQGDRHARRIGITPACNLNAQETSIIRVNPWS